MSTPCEVPLLLVASALFVSTPNPRSRSASLTELADVEASVRARLADLGRVAELEPVAARALMESLFPARLRAAVVAGVRL